LGLGLGLNFNAPPPLLQADAWRKQLRISVSVEWKLARWCFASFSPQECVQIQYTTY